MPVQLDLLVLRNFRWLLHVAKYVRSFLSFSVMVMIDLCSAQALDDLRPHALSSLRRAEFGLQSCHIGNDDLIRAGGQLVTCLSALMPKLQTLRLWRTDDFLLTTGESHFERE